MGWVIRSNDVTQKTAEVENQNVAKGFYRGEHLNSGKLPCKNKYHS